MLQRSLGCAAVVTLLSFALAAGTPASSVTTAALAAVVLTAALLLAALAPSTAGVRIGAASGVAHDERRCRGSFRRQSQPDAPGRPLPRAPQVA